VFVFLAEARNHPRLVGPMVRLIRVDGESPLEMRARLLLVGPWAIRRVITKHVVTAVEPWLISGSAVWTPAV
jgi:hypothetical protein